MRKSKLAAAAIGFALHLGLPSFAQQSDTPRVVSVDGPPGAVLVVRRDRIDFATANLALAPGDEVATRVDGGATIRAGTCESKLGPVSSVRIDADFCASTPRTLISGKVHSDPSGVIRGFDAALNDILASGAVPTGAASKGGAGDGDLKKLLQ